MGFVLREVAVFDRFNTRDIPVSRGAGSVREKFTSYTLGQWAGSANQTGTPYMRGKNKDTCLHIVFVHSTEKCLRAALSQTSCEGTQQNMADL